MKMLDQLKERYNIDERAIFATGASNGGMMTHYFASRHPEVVTAVMPVYGLPLSG